MADSRLLGLDVGDARIGVALSDPLAMFAQPFKTLEHDRSIFENIAELIKSHHVHRIIVGLPYELDGSLGPQSEKVRKFADKLKKLLPRLLEQDFPEIIFWDERLTSVQAEQAMIGSKLKNKQRAAMVDKIAASLILQSYMDSRSS